MRPLYVVGTERDVGKTTLCIGLMKALRQRGLTVGFTKPLGQRVGTFQGQCVHEDALLVAQAMEATPAESVPMAVPLTRGRVEQEIYELRAPELAKKVGDACLPLRRDHDLLILEGMGHVGMGACVGLSAAEVARIVGAKVLIVSGGGIGSAIDNIALCATYVEARRAELSGVIINKIWPDKYRRVRDATAKGLDNLGLRALGAVPFEPVLTSPTVRQVVEHVGGQVVSGADGLDARVRNTVVAAMEAHHMVSYLKNRCLVITPGDRSDNILATLSTYVLSKDEEPAVVGVVLTGGFRPGGKVMELIQKSALPFILCREDTYTLAARLRNVVFKITGDDAERIEAAAALVAKYVDVDGILDTLRE